MKCIRRLLKSMIINFFLVYIICQFQEKVEPKQEELLNPSKNHTEDTEQHLSVEKKGGLCVEQHLVVNMQVGRNDPSVEKRTTPTCEVTEKKDNCNLI